VLDSAGNNEEFALFEPDPAVTELHVEPALDNQEELVFLLMVVPLEGTAELDQLDVLAIEYAYDLGLPMIAEKGELLFQVDLFHMRIVAERPASPQEHLQTLPSPPRMEG
jgi:hypothetical protein